MNKFFRIIIFSLIGLLLVLSSCSNKKKNDDNNNNNNGDQNPPTKNEYTVIYSVVDGAFEDGSTIFEETYVEGTTVNIIKQIPVREGYDFVGWKNMDTGEIINSSFVINNDMFFVEEWALESYEVVLKAGVGKFENGLNEIVYSVEQNSQFKYNNLPIHSDRIFSGWYDEDGNYFVEGTTITSDITLTAKYRTPGNEYNLKYVLNVALFGKTAKQWREENPDLKGNIRDYANMNELICLSNLENINSVLINEQVPQTERLVKLNQIAIYQISVLQETENRKLLK